MRSASGISCTCFNTTWRTSYNNKVSVTLPLRTYMTS
jgi:hypothetical protein